MRPKAEWAIDSEAMRARGIIVLVIQLAGQKYRDKVTLASKTRPLFWFSNPALLTTSGL